MRKTQEIPFRKFSSTELLVHDEKVRIPRYPLDNKSEEHHRKHGFEPLNLWFVSHGLIITKTPVTVEYTGSRSTLNREVK